MKSAEERIRNSLLFGWRRGLKGYRDSKQQKEADENLHLVFSSILRFESEKLRKMDNSTVISISIKQMRGTKFQNFRKKEKKIAYCLIFSQSDIWREVKKRKKLSLKTVRKYIKALKETGLVKKLGKRYVLNHEMLEDMVADAIKINRKIPKIIGEIRRFRSSIVEL